MQLFPPPIIVSVLDLDASILLSIGSGNATMFLSQHSVGNLTMNEHSSLHVLVKLQMLLILLNYDLYESVQAHH